MKISSFIGDAAKGCSLKKGGLNCIMKSKKFFYTWDDIDENNKNAGTMIEDIIADPELPQLEELIIGCWGESWNNNAQPIVDGIVEHKEKFANVKHLFIGDMDFEECEVSWIEQADYSKLWAALPALEQLTIKGSSELELGEINHSNLKSFEIICGGLPVSVIQSIEKAKLPQLEELMLYIGVEDYGFDGDVSDIEKMLENSDFSNLKILGLMDSEIQDEITEVVVKSKYMKQIQKLALSYGTLTDKGGEILLKELPSFENIKEVDLEYHYLSDKMVAKLDKLSIDIWTDDPQEDDEYDGEVYRYPMLTE